MQHKREPRNARSALLRIQAHSSRGVCGNVSGKVRLMGCEREKSRNTSQLAGEASASVVYSRNKRLEWERENTEDEKDAKDGRKRRWQGKAGEDTAGVPGSGLVDQRTWDRGRTVVGTGGATHGAR